MSQRVERSWIHTGGYGQFRGEWVKLFSVCQLTKIALKFWGVSYNQVCLLKPKNMVPRSKSNELKEAQYTSDIPHSQAMRPSSHTASYPGSPDATKLHNHIATV